MVSALSRRATSISTFAVMPGLTRESSAVSSTSVSNVTTSRPSGFVPFVPTRSTLPGTLRRVSDCR